MLNLVDEIIERHGGWDTWNHIEELCAQLTFGGLAFRSRFNTKGLIRRKVYIDTRQPKVVFDDYPKKGNIGFFSNDAVWITDRFGNEVARLDHARSTFQKLSRQFWWNDLALLYFAGYACWNYFNVPFLLANDQIQLIELPKWKENGSIWRRVKAVIPSDIPTHCEEQVFYFDDDLKLVRHDYNPEVFASWAKAAHYCYDHKTFDGILTPTKRKVFPRKGNNQSLSMPTLVWIALDHLTIRRISNMKIIKNLS